MPQPTDITISSIEIGDDIIQITYVEHRDANLKTGIIEARTLVVPVSILDEEEADALIDAAMTVIDKAKLRQRNPPGSFTRPR